MDNCAHGTQRVEGIVEGDLLRWRCESCGLTQDRRPAEESFSPYEPLRWAEQVPAEPEVTRPQPRVFGLHYLKDLNPIRVQTNWHSGAVTVFGIDGATLAVIQTRSRHEQQEVRAGRAEPDVEAMHQTAAELVSLLSAVGVPTALWHLS